MQCVRNKRYCYNMFLEKQNPVGSTGMLLLKIQIQKDMKEQSKREREMCEKSH